MSLAPAGFVGELVGNIHQKNNNQNQGYSYLNYGICSPEITHFSNSFSNKTVKIKKIIPSVISIINIVMSRRVLGKAIFGPIKEPINQAAEILIDRAESALSQYRGIFFTKASLIGGQIGVNQSLGRSKTLSEVEGEL